MPKLKTRRAAAKRFNTTGTGKIKRMKPYKSHILESKSPKRKRNLRKATLVSKTMSHPELGRDLLVLFADELKDTAHVEKEPKIEGRNMTMVIAVNKK